MGYSVAFLGDLTFPGGGYEKWLAASIDAALFADWPDGWKPEDTWSVDQVLSDIDGMIVSLERDEKHVKLRLLVSNDDGFYLENRQNLLAAFRQAGACGGSGGLTVIGWGDSDRFAVRAGADGICAELEAEARDAVEESAAYRELESLSEASRATEKKRIAAFIRKREAEADNAVRAVAAAPTLEEAIARFRAAAGKKTFAELRDVYTLQHKNEPLVAALVAYPVATPRLCEELRALVGTKAEWEPRPANEDLSFTFLLLDVLFLRGDAEAEVLNVWLDYPDRGLRNLAGLHALGRPDIETRIAKAWGVSAELESEVVEALFAVETEETILARANQLMEGDLDLNRVAEDALRWVAIHLGKHPELRSPGWEAWVTRMAGTHMRAYVVGHLVAWGLPGVLATVLACFDELHSGVACGLIEKYGDTSAIPTLQKIAASQRFKETRREIEAVIAKLSGELPAAPVAKKTRTKKKPSTTK